MQKTFRAIDVGDGSDGRWGAHLRTLFPEAEDWLTDDGRPLAGPGYTTGLRTIILVDTPRGCYSL